MIWFELMRWFSIVLQALFVMRGAPAHLRSDNGPEFIAYAIQDWLNDRQCQTLYITPGKSLGESLYREL